MKFNKMPKIKDLYTNIGSVLEEIAFINIQKLPGGTSTTTSALKKYYTANKEIILAQIKTYRPDIVIGGSTLNLIKMDLALEKKDELQFGHFKKNKMLFINTHHPQQSRVTREEYVDKIISRAKMWKAVYSN